MRYVPLCLTFLAALVALLGPARDDAKSGVAAITPVGYLVVATALLGLAVGLYAQHQQDRELRRERERTSVRRQRALAEIAGASEMLFWIVHRVAYFASDAVRRERRPVVDWELLGSEEVIGDLEAFDMVHLMPPPAMQGPYAFPLGTDARPLVALVTEESTAQLNRLNAVVDLSGEVLEAEEIEAVTDLCTHAFMRWMTQLREQFAKLARIEDSEYYLVSLVPRGIQLGGTSDSYSEFVALGDRVTAAGGTADTGR
jgi:hypothetical protein